MQVAVDCIDVVSGTRAEEPQELDFLALSIKKSGLINRPTVVENPEIVGRFNIVAGRRRLNAVRKLGWEMIDVSVMSGSQADCKLVELAENLCRLDLSAIEKAEATKEYVELVAATDPGVKIHLESRSRYNATKDKEEKAGDIREVIPDDAPTPVEAVAAKFQRSPHAIRKDIKIASSFTDDEKLVLKDRNLSQRKLTALASTAPADKVQVINLLASGMAFPEAMKDVLGDKYADDGDDEDPISDEDFLASCTARAKSCKPRFDADALLYRSLQKQRQSFAKAIGWGTTKAKVGEMGIYARRLMLFMEAKHPRDWLQCHNCVRGVTNSGPCGHCKGGGYMIG